MIPSLLRVGLAVLILAGGCAPVRAQVERSPSSGPCERRR